MASRWTAADYRHDAAEQTDTCGLPDIAYEWDEARQRPTCACGWKGEWHSPATDRYPTLASNAEVMDHTAGRWWVR